MLSEEKLLKNHYSCAKLNVDNDYLQMTGEVEWK